MTQPTPAAGGTAFELLERVRREVTGARQTFVLARLSLRCGFDVKALAPDDRDADRAARLRAAIREVCPQVPL